MTIVRRSVTACIVAVIFALTLVLPTIVAAQQTAPSTPSQARSKKTTPSTTYGKTTGKTTAKTHAKKTTKKKAVSKSATAGRGPCPVYGTSHRYRGTAGYGRGTTMKCACGKTTHRYAKKSTKMRKSTARRSSSAMMGRGPCPVYGKYHHYRSTSRYSTSGARYGRGAAGYGRGTTMKCACGKTTHRYAKKSTTMRKSTARRSSSAMMGRGPCPVYGTSHRYRSTSRYSTSGARYGKGATMKCACGKTTKAHAKRYTVRRSSRYTGAGAGMGPAKKSTMKKTHRPATTKTKTAGQKKTSGGTGGAY